jgi:hypothetical protein
MVFVEDPWSRVVAVHWADDGGPTEPPVPGAPYCGRYGYGARMEDIGTLITALPFGPNQLPPMAGTFSTGSNTGEGGGARYGGLNGALMHPVETMTAAPYGLVATSIFLGPATMTFTNNQLMSMQDAGGEYGSIGWVVPMAEGQTTFGGIPIPIVIKSYAISMDWAGSYVDPDDEVGIGISHPIHDFTGVVLPPPEPAVVLGPRLGGSGAFVYDFKYAEWASGNIHVNEGNQYDPGLGGPAFLWWMTRRAGGTWNGSGQFMLSTLVGLGDDYTWEIVGTCQPEPPLT